MQHPRVLQLVMDSLRYWVDRDARRRLPLRPRLGAGARAARRRPAQRLLRHPAPGPGAVAREADRRALGPRRRRLPGRQLPGRLGRVERQVPRHDAAPLEGRRRHDRRARAAPHRLERPLRPQQPAALREHQLRHRARRLHAADLVSYNDKHNEANGEDNRDGHDHNLSWNCGVEGPTDDPTIRALRARQQRNLLATLLLSQGVPMLLAGDEIGRTQGGNNNAYCQDNEISWIDWSARRDRARRCSLHAALIALRAAHPVFRAARLLPGPAAARQQVATSSGCSPTATR